MKLFRKNSNTNLCDHNPPTSRTDGQIDRETTCDRKTALCTKVHHAKTTSTGSSSYCYAQEMSLIRPVTKRRSGRRNPAYSDILFTVIWWRRGSRLTEPLRAIMSKVFWHNASGMLFYLCLLPLLAVMSYLHYRLSKNYNQQLKPLVWCRLNIG